MKKSKEEIAREIARENMIERLTIDYPHSYPADDLEAKRRHEERLKDIYRRAALQEAREKAARNKKKTKD